MLLAAWVLPVAGAGTGSAASGEPTAGATTVRRADVEFVFQQGASPEAKARTALALWRTGVVERVVGPDDSHHNHRLYVRDPNNLLQSHEVHRLLESRTDVLFVASLTGWMIP